MKILVRETKETENGVELNYVWKVCEKEIVDIYELSKLKTKDGKTYYETEILKIQNDFRKNAIYCRNCKKIMTLDQWKKHYEKNISKIDCFNCPYKSERITEKIKVTYKKLDDGSYMKSSKENVTLYCGYSTYGYRTTIEDNINRCKNDECGYDCIHYKCKSFGHHNCEQGIFGKYPKLNDILITEAALIENGWKLERNANDKRVYSAKGRLKNLNAIVDNNGVLIKFCYIYRKTSYEFIYSKIYDKIFRICYGTKYLEGLSRDILSTTKDAITEKIKELYK